MTPMDTLIRDFMCSIGENFDQEQLQLIKNKLCYFLDEYDVCSKKELPSTEVISSDKLITYFLSIKKISGCTDATLACYSYHLKYFATNVNSENLLDLSTNHIRKYLAQLLTHASKSYVDDARRILNSFYNTLEKEDMLYGKNPMKKIDKIKKEECIKKPFSDTEIELLKQACEDDVNQNHLRNKCIISFLLSTGCRRNELRNIKVQDLDINDRTVYLRECKGQKQRIVCFSARTQLYLKQYLKEFPHNDYLFCKKDGTGLSNHQINNICNRIGNLAGVKSHTHKYRRTAATHFANNNLPLQDIQAILGHSNIATTNKYYVEANKERIKTSFKAYAI